MIVAIVEQFHDDEARTYLIDTDKLDQTNHIDNLILKKINNKKTLLHLFVDATNWDNKNSPYNGIEPGVSEKAVIKESEDVAIDKTLHLKIFFDC